MAVSTSVDQNTHVIFCTGHICKDLELRKKWAKIDKEVENEVMKSYITEK